MWWLLLVSLLGCLLGYAKVLSFPQLDALEELYLDSDDLGDLWLDNWRWHSKKAL
jgi:hypothetical protein